MTTTTLPRMLDARALADELGIARASAERMMRHIGVTPVGRRYYVTDQQVRDCARVAVACVLGASSETRSG